MRKKDVVLMATVTSFESLPHPSRSELRQFAELFSPLFSASSEEARRDAVAALSQCDNVPPAVAYFIASQPITVAATFLTSSTCLSDDALIAIARTQGEAHARAIVRREALSPMVIDALVGLRHDRTSRRDASRMTEAPVAEAVAEAVAAPPAADVPASVVPDSFVQRPANSSAAMSGPALQAPIVPRESLRTGATHSAAVPTKTMVDEAERLAREEQLRRRIKSLAGHIDRPADDRLGLRNLSPIQEALLVRFARNRETGLFATVLADTLSASHWLSERIMLDISGQQLATTLKGLAMETADALYILQRLYDHLSLERDGISRAEMLWDVLDTDECGQRVEAWRRADTYTYSDPQRQSDFAADRGMAEREQISKVIRTTASARRPMPTLRRAR